MRTQQEVAFFFLCQDTFLPAEHTETNSVDWNQHKKGQKCVDCRKDVINFISSGCSVFST